MTGSESGGMAERSAIQTSPRLQSGSGMSSDPPIRRYRANVTSSSSYCVALPSTEGQAVAGNSPVYGPGWEFPLVVAQGVAGKPGLFLPGRTVYFAHSSQGCSRMTLYGYARVSVREPLVFEPDP